MTIDPIPRMLVAERMKTMLRLPGVVVLDANRLEVTDPSLFDEALRRAYVASGILGRRLGHTTGSSLVLTVFPVERG